MKRVITSFKNANKDVLKEISILYPKGVEDSDLISFPTVDGKRIRALEIEVGDSLYLVKMEDENYYRKYLAKDDEEDEDEDSDSSDSDIDVEEDIDEEFDGEGVEESSSDDEDEGLGEDVDDDMEDDD